MQKVLMAYKDHDGDGIEQVVCGVSVGAGCEYTLCGNAFPDFIMEKEGVECIDDNVKGKITCGSCIGRILQAKALKKGKDY